MPSCAGHETPLIHVLPLSAFRRDAVEHNVTEGWHAALGRAIKTHTPYRNIACWTVDFDLDEPYQFQQEGIEYRVFPSRLVPGTRNRFVKPYIGQAKPGIELSLSLLRAARQAAADGAALHLHADPFMNTYLLAGLIRDAPVFLQHHGGLHGAVPLERLAFRDLTHAFVLTPGRRRTLVHEAGVPPDRITVRTMGVDTERFAPRNVTPTDLGYDADELLLYVGQYYSYKGLDRVLDAFEILREERDVALSLLGGTADDELYQRARRTEGVVPKTKFLSTEQMSAHYAAADAYVSYPVKKSLRSGDCGIIAPMEALACGTPVVSPTLTFLPASDRDGVGYIPHNTSDFVQKIEATLSSQYEPEHCAAVAAKHFSWRVVATDVATVYDRYLC